MGIATQKEMMDKFMSAVNASIAYGNYMSKAGEYLERLNISTDYHWEGHSMYTDAYLNNIVEIMDVNKISDLIADEWFWAEWTSSEKCFMFVYGYTAHVREEREVQQFNNERRKEEDEVLAKAGKIMEVR